MARTSFLRWMASAAAVFLSGAAIAAIPATEQALRVAPQQARECPVTRGVQQEPCLKRCKLEAEKTQPPAKAAPEPPTADRSLLRPKPLPPLQLIGYPRDFAFPAQVRG